MIDEKDSRENLENDLIPEPQQLSETVQNDTGGPLAENYQSYLGSSMLQTLHSETNFLETNFLI